MASGMKAFAAGLDKLGDSGAGLVAGLAEIIDGMSQLADGLAKTAGEMGKLPGEVQKLVDGQTELMDGITTASKTCDEWDLGGDPSAAPVSFASPGHSPRSVQFIYKTPQLANAAEDNKPAEPAQKDKGFFEKLADLFR
jgi:putative membrane protein